MLSDPAAFWRGSRSMLDAEHPSTPSTLSQQRSRSLRMTENKLGHYRHAQQLETGKRRRVGGEQMRACRDHSLRDQMQRCAVSISSNIAEGYERNTNKEFIQHPFIAKGSYAELRTQVSLCIQLGILDNATGNGLLERTRKISAMLFK